MNDLSGFALTGESVRQDEPRVLDLRPYQAAAITSLADGARAQHRCQLMVAPTGSGKTCCAVHLMQKADAKASRAVFICDRVALVDQTSHMFDVYGIQHGVMQANHWRTQPWQRIQVASAQTLAKRGWKGEPFQLILVDEAHTLYKSVTDFIKDNPQAKVVGLTATPFTKGMAALYTNVVNVSTTNNLVDEGFLVPLKCYAGISADMRGAKTKSDGEWQDSEIEKRGLVIIGDIVTEWVDKTTLNFDGPVKTIAFSATVAHGEEICKRFQGRGYNFQQVSYKDGNDDRRRALIEEFRKEDSEIIGLVSCEALAKGFDVPDILCGISAKPYRKSLSGHIQQIGRVMRPFPGKAFALWLDHSGNILRFNTDTAKVFAEGVSTLDDGEHDAKVRKELDEKEKERLLCKGCGFIMGGAQRCPSCGLERPKPRSGVEEIGGEMVEVAINGKVKHQAPWLEDKTAVARQLWHIALERKGGDREAASRFANAQFRNIYNEWPYRAIRNLEPMEPDPRLVGKVQSQIIAWAKRQQRRA